MKRLLLLLVLIPFLVYAAVDTKDGTAITTANNQDGFTAAIAKVDGQTISSGVSCPASMTQVPTANSSEFNTWTASSAGNKYADCDDPVGSPDDDDTYSLKQHQMARSNLQTDRL